MPLKDTLHDLLVRGSLEQVAELAQRKKRVLGSLVSLTYDPDPLISWRAVETMGLACDRLADTDPGSVRQHLRRLYWLITEESGGICWRAPEAMAEVIHHRPKLLADFLPIVVYLIQEMAEEDLDHFRPGVLWAIGRLGPACGDHIPNIIDAIAGALGDPKPQVRGLAVWCLAAVGEVEYVKSRPGLLSDDGPVELYEGRHLIQTRVNSLVHRVVT